MRRCFSEEGLVVCTKQRQLVITISGFKCSGKTTLAQGLRERIPGSRVLRVTDLLARQLREQGMSDCRDSVVGFYRELLGGEGGDAYTTNMALSFMAEEPAPLYIWDGLRRPTQLSALKMDDRFLVRSVFITVNPAILYSRLCDESLEPEDISLEAFFDSRFVDPENRILDIKDCAQIVLNGSVPPCVVLEELERYLNEPV